ncbi:response regulator [Adhaeribacter aquaticus]|uniref:response regulator n=1 Tax=Adhaeribacter aquaticus TaxID=299567 RepID=UPI0004203407|nr:response regulator [Adhaeribacter aquaticus]
MRPLDLILLVDDDDTTNYVNKRTLQRTNAAHEIKVFTNGEQALTYIKNSVCGTDGTALNPCPDLIFLDIKMPIMDGFEFLEAYKTLGLSKTAPTTIMMLTSSASFYDLKKLETYEEVKRHFSKPLADHDVKEIIKDYFPANAD